MGWGSGIHYPILVWLEIKHIKGGFKEFFGRKFREIALTSYSVKNVGSEWVVSFLRCRSWCPTENWDGAASREVALSIACRELVQWNRCQTVPSRMSWLMTPVIHEIMSRCSWQPVHLITSLALRSVVAAELLSWLRESAPYNILDAHYQGLLGILLAFSKLKIFFHLQPCMKFF